MIQVILAETGVSVIDFCHSIFDCKHHGGSTLTGNLAQARNNCANCCCGSIKTGKLIFRSLSQILTRFVIMTQLKILFDLLGS